MRGEYKCVLFRYLRIYWKRIGKRVREKEKVAILRGSYRED
jgi:hypothetical protein